MKKFPQAVWKFIKFFVKKVAFIEQQNSLPTSTWQKDELF